MVYAADARWWRYHGSDVMRKFTGERWTTRSRTGAHPEIESEIEDYELQAVYGQDGRGLGRYDLHYGGNSGYSAINLAYYLGASKIYLLGYDMSVEHHDNGKPKVHWHGDHPPQLNNGSNHYGTWIENFAQLAADLSREGVEVVNCTRRTALTCFPQATVEEICELNNS